LLWVNSNKSQKYSVKVGIYIMHYKYLCDINVAVEILFAPPYRVTLYKASKIRIEGYGVPCLSAGPVLRGRQATP
jgi:hypothetical protein